MKKIFLLQLVLITLCSCKKLDKPTVFDNEYATNFSIHSEDNRLSITSADTNMQIPLDYKCKKCIITTTSASAYRCFRGNQYNSRSLFTSLFL